MSYWFLPLIAAFCAVLVVLFFALRARRRKQESLQLRLLAGQERLLSEEIDRRMAMLEDLPQDKLQARRQRAEESLDQLNMDLIERQAHLLNFEDLIHLQQCKLQLLVDRSEDLETPAASPSEVPPPPAESTGQPRDRGQLEDQLRTRISQLREGRQPGKQRS